MKYYLIQCTFERNPPLQIRRMIIKIYVEDVLIKAETLKDAIEKIKKENKSKLIDYINKTLE